MKSGGWFLRCVGRCCFGGGLSAPERQNWRKAAEAATASKTCASYSRSQYNAGDNGGDEER